jgi:archaellum component FlaC
MAPGSPLDKIFTLLTAVKNDVEGIKNDVEDIKTDVEGLKADVAGLKTDVEGLKGDVRQLAEKVDGINSCAVESSLPGRQIVTVCSCRCAETREA